MFVKSLLLFGAAAILTVTTLTAAEVGVSPLRNYRYVRTLRPLHPTPAIGITGVWELDATVYRAIPDDLESGINLTDQNGNFVPFALERKLAPGVRALETRLAGKIVGARDLPDGRYLVEFELDRPSESIGAVELVTPEKNFDVNLAVQIGDGNNWVTVVENQRFFDFANQLNLARRRFNFAVPTGGNSVRILFSSAPEQGGKAALRIDAVRVFERTNVAVPELPVVIGYPLTELSSNREKEHTVIVWQSDSEPITRLQLTSDTPNYQRRVTLSGSNDRLDWRPLSGGTLRRVDLDNLESIEFPESRFRYYRLEIDNDGHPELTNLRCEAYGNVYFLNFAGAAVDAAGELSLYYSGAGGDRSSAVMRGMTGKTVAAYNALEERRNPEYGIGRRKWGAPGWLSLGCGALLLLIMSIMLLRIKNIDQELPAE